MRLIRPYIILLVIILTQLSAAKPSPGSKIFAVIVGISSYKNIRSLAYADKDALSFYGLFCNSVFGHADSSDGFLLLNEAATAGNIQAALTTVAGLSDSTDKVIFYFAGHGDVESSNNGDEAFLLANDAPANSYQAGGSIAVSYLQDFINKLALKNVRSAIFIDACRSGELAGSETGKNLTLAAFSALWNKGVKLLSCFPGQTALESNRWGGGHGLFSYHVTLALSGLADADNNNVVSLNEVNTYLIEKVPASARPDVQNPMVTGPPNLPIAWVKDNLALLNLDIELTETAVKRAVATGLQPPCKLSTSESRLWLKIQQLLSGKSISAQNLDSVAAHIDSARQQALCNPVLLQWIRNYVAAKLVNNAQEVINNYMIGGSAEWEKPIFQHAADELALALRYLNIKETEKNDLNARHLFLRGRALSKEKNKDSLALALLLLKKALRIAPEAAYIYNALGLAYLSASQLELAESFFSDAVELSPKWNYPLLNLGVLFSMQHNNIAARSVLLKSLKLMPDDDAYLTLGVVYDAMAKELLCDDEVIIIADDAEETDTSVNSSDSLLIFRQKAYSDSADLCFRAALRLNPSNMKALQAYFLFFSRVYPEMVEGFVENYKAPFSTDPVLLLYYLRFRVDNELTQDLQVKPGLLRMLNDYQNCPVAAEYCRYVEKIPLHFINPDTSANGLYKIVGAIVNGKTEVNKADCFWAVLRLLEVSDYDKAILLALKYASLFGESAISSVLLSKCYESVGDNEKFVFFSAKAENYLKSSDCPEFKVEDILVNRTTKDMEF